MGDYNLSLEIKTVGANTALAALDDLDRKGRAIVEDVAGATGRAMGDVAAAYVNGSRRVQMALEDIALAHRENIAELESQGTAAERLSSRYGTASVSAARALEVIGRTGKETGRSLDTLIAQASQVAFSFGAAGPIVGAIGIATAAVVEMFMRASRESQKLVDAIAKDFERIARMDLQGQGAAVQELYGGDKASADPYKSASLKELERLRAVAQQTIAGGTSTFVGAFGATSQSLSDDAKKATEDLKALNEELRRRNDLLHSVMGPGGSFARASAEQVASDQPGFITDQLKEQERAAKAAARAWDKAVKAFSDDVEARKKAFDELVRATVAKITNSDDPNLSGIERVSRFDARSFSEEGGPLGHLLDGIVPEHAQLAKQLHETIRLAVEEVRNNPAVKAAESAKKLGAELGHIISAGLAEGLVTALDAGFQKAFSGGGAIGFLQGFGSAVLQSFGSIMEQMGAALIKFGVAMELVSAGLSNPFTSGPAAIAAGALLVGLGAALKAAVGGHGAGTGSSYSGGSSVIAPDYLTFGVSAATAPPTTSQPAPAARSNYNFTIIGPADPQAQRAIGDLVGRADKRGLINWAPG